MYANKGLTDGLIEMCYLYHLKAFPDFFKFWPTIESDNFSIILGK